MDRHPVIGVLGFVLLGAFVGTDALLNLLFKLTLVTDDFTWHVCTYHVNGDIITFQLIRHLISDCWALSTESCNVMGHSLSVGVTLKLGEMQYHV